MLAEYLVDRGFEPRDPVRQGIGHGHEFKRGNVFVDILAPDNLGRRANLQTLHQARTVSVPGGTQALQRAETVEVRLGMRIGTIPVPSLLGAILLKAGAIAVDDVPDAQKVDLAVLLSLVVDRDELSAQLARGERQLLRRYPQFADPADPVYEGLARAREAAATYRRLVQE